MICPTCSGHGKLLDPEEDCPRVRSVQECRADVVDLLAQWGKAA